MLWVIHMHFVHYVGVKHKLSFYYVQQPGWWLALAVAWI